MLFTPIYIILTFIKSWRIRTFRTRLQQFLDGNTSVAFCKIPENAAETPTLSSKLCTNPKIAYLCDLLDYTDATRICSMKPTQSIEISDWVSCTGGLPLGSSDLSPDAKLDIEVLFECEMHPHEEGCHQDIVKLQSVGQPIAWKAGSHLAIIIKTNMEKLSLMGFNFVEKEFITDHKLPVVRIQTVQLSGEPNKATDVSMRSLRSEIQQGLRHSSDEFQWPVHATLLRKLSKVVDAKSESRNAAIEMNGTSNIHFAIPNVTSNVPSADVSLNATKRLTQEELKDSLVLEDTLNDNEIKTISLDESFINYCSDEYQKNVTVTDCNLHLSQSDLQKDKCTSFCLQDELRTHGSGKAQIGADATTSQAIPTNQDKSPERLTGLLDEAKLVLDNVTVEIQHNVTPNKSSLKLDLKKGAGQLSTSLLNISSQIKSVTTHKRIVSTTGPKKAQNRLIPDPKEFTQSSSIVSSTPKKHLLKNTKSLNVVIYSDSVVARDNLEASLRKVLDDRYTVSSVTREALEAGEWRGRGRAALVAAAGCVDRAALLLLAHLLDGGKLLALCSDLLHTVLPYYKTAEIRENEVVQFSFDKWTSVKMKHHIFCYQASPAKKQFSTETERQPSKYTGHPGHELDIKVLASEETWRTPSLLQATDLTHGGVAIFSQIHLEADPSEYLGEEGAESNQARLEILHKILGDILGLHVRDPRDFCAVDYTEGFFLGNHLDKTSLLKGWIGSESGQQRLGTLTVQWCRRNEPPAFPPSAQFLPIQVYGCPEHFSTVDYYDNLQSSVVGRVLVYADVLDSTCDVTGGAPLGHGVGAVAGSQRRARSHWLSPPGHAAISLQIWQSMSPRLSLMQHAAALAAVRALQFEPAHAHLDFRIKWPNDIYYGREVKIGRTLTTSKIYDDTVIINIGTGVNISNSAPTSCVNNIISEYNNRNNTSLPPLTVERFLARYCTQLERMLDYMKSDAGVDAFLEQYYQYWLHTDEMIRVMSKDESSPVEGHISGVDSAGWLLVKTPRGQVRVSPDDNSLDLTRGLVVPIL